MCRWAVSVDGEDCDETQHYLSLYKIKYLKLNHKYLGNSYLKHASQQTT